MINLTVNGVTFPYPETGDNNWGVGATNWASAVTSGMLSKAGGSFPLTAVADFGTNFGIKVLSVLSETANSSGTGFIKLANSEGLGWRNSGNSADYVLKPDADGLLQYNSIDLVNLSATQTLTNKSMSGSANTFTNISLATAITGVLPIANGGTDNGSLAVTAGGTLYTDGTKIVNVGAGSTGQVLTSQGSSAPTWTSPLTNPMTTLGDLISGGASGAATRLAGDTTNARVFLKEQSSGGVATAAAWVQIQASDILGGTLATARGGTNSDSSAATGIAKVASGTWSYSNTISSAITFSGGLVGSLGTGSASTGNVGEYVESIISSATSMTAATTAFQDMTSISLTAGDWDVSLHTDGQNAGGTVTTMDIGISTTTGNSTTGLVFGSNRLEYPGPTSSTDQGGTIASYRMLLTATTTVFAKLSMSFNSTAPKYRCRLSARRSANTQG